MTLWRKTETLIVMNRDFMTMKTKIEQKYANITPKMGNKKPNSLIMRWFGFDVEVGTGIEPV